LKYNDKNNPNDLQVLTGHTISIDPVGTLVTERPPDRSVRARLRIRLL
jgi:hypothetical protein